jgi:predicted dehydrogenase
MKAGAANHSLRVAIVGLGGISALHFKAIAAARGVQLAAVCDLNPELVAAQAAAQGVPGFADISRMLAEIRPDVVTVATDTRSHAKLTMLAAQAGVRAVHCEKPMALHPAEAHAMVAACSVSGALLTINHQRRLGDVAAARRAIVAGSIGDVLELRGYCAGDLLSDGTHVVDSLLALAGDPAVSGVLGALDLSTVRERYGHAVESGAHLEIRSDHALQMSVATGSFGERRAYQEYHVLGSRGSLWRTGDSLKPNWYIADGEPGTHAPVFDRQRWFTHPELAAAGGPWRPLDIGTVDACGGEVAAYEQIAASLATGAPHPLDGQRSLTVQTVLMAGYQSGLMRQPVTLEEVKALEQFPLSS